MLELGSWLIAPSLSHAGKSSRGGVNNYAANLTTMNRCDLERVGSAGGAFMIIRISNEKPSLVAAMYSTSPIHQLAA
jgi:hypothetical protein